MKLNTIVTALFSAYAVSLTPVSAAQEVSEAESSVQSGTASPKLELIEVTAQRRVQSIQEVPISVQAFNAEQLDRAAIDKIDDLQLYIPNLTLTETGLSTQMYIRGVGSGNSQGFEQSVVQFIDGVSYARQQLSRAPFFDMERAEVLRGPQSILFGKNAIGGALNLSTAKVQEYNSGKFFAQAGEYGIREYQGVVNRELYDGKLYGRLSLRHYEEDGYVKNSTLGSDEPNREDQAIRLKLLYLLNDDWQINAKYERSDFETLGRQIEMLQDIGDPGLPFGVTLSQGFGVPGAIPETELNYTRTSNGDTSFNDIENFNFEITGMIGELEFESRTAWLEYSYEENCDCDFVGANIFTIAIDEDYDQFSQEFRIASDINNEFSWQAGIFYQRSDLKFNDNILVPESQIGRADLGVLPTAIFALTGDAVQASSFSNVGAARDFTQDAESFSIFAQATYKFNPRTQVTLGARWSTEDKEGFREINIVDQSSGLVVTSPIAPAVFESLFQIINEQSSGHSVMGSRSETALDPSINIQHFLNDDVMLYGTWSKGSKSGGFDTRANTPNSFEFENEEVNAFELGIKTTFWEQRGKLNVALYSTDYEDLQVSQFDGNVGFQVGNADAEMKGVEVDGSFALTEDLTFSYSAAYLDHEFTDYKDGNCYYRQRFDSLRPDKASRYNGETGLCDYTGMTGPYAPEFSANLNLDYYYELTNSANLHVNVNYNFTDDQNTHQNLDPDFEQAAVGRVDVNIALEFDDWGIELLGRNITDEEFVSFSSNAPLSGTFGADTVYGFVAPPSVWSLRGYYNF